MIAVVVYAAGVHGLNSRIRGFVRVALTLDRDTLFAAPGDDVDALVADVGRVLDVITQQAIRFADVPLELFWTECIKGANGAPLPAKPCLDETRDNP